MYPLPSCLAAGRCAARCLSLAAGNQASAPKAPAGRVEDLLSLRDPDMLTHFGATHGDYFFGAKKNEPWRALMGLRARFDKHVT